MTRQLWLATASLTLFAPIHAAPVPKAVPKDYFPLRIGHKWEYVNPDGTASHTEEVTAEDEKDGAKLYTVIRTREGGAETKLVYRVDKDGVARARVGPLDYDPPMLVVKPTLTSGDTWTAKLSISKREAEYEMVVGKAEEVKTPAGVFTAVPVEERNAARKGGAATTSWYAAGVGRVQSGAGDRLVTQLKAFTPGKGEKK